MTFRTGGLAAIATEHHPVLNLVLVVLHHLEEVVDGYPVVFSAVLVGGQSVPQLVFLLLGQAIVRLEDGKIVLSSPTTELFLPHLHLLAMPTDHTAIIDGERGVGDDEMLVDAHHLAKALTFRTGTHG